MASSEGYAVIWTLLQERGWCLSHFKPHRLVFSHPVQGTKVGRSPLLMFWWMPWRLMALFQTFLLLLHSEASILRGRMLLIRRSVPKTSVYLMYVCLWAEWECQTVAWSEGKIRGPLDKHVSIDTIHYRKGRSEILLARCGVWILH